MSGGDGLTGPPAAGSPRTPPEPDEQRRLAERRMMDEMTRQRRAEAQQLVTLRYGCLSVIGLLILLLVLGFMLS